MELVTNRKPTYKTESILSVRHEQDFLPDKGSLILKSFKKYETFTVVDQSNFEISNFSKIKELEERFKNAMSHDEKEAIFNELKNLDFIKKAFEETRCLGEFIATNENTKDYKLAAVVRPVTKYAGCKELNKRSKLQQRYYQQ